MAAAGAREICDCEVVVVGIGLPWIVCTLAKRTHAPRLTFLLGIGHQCGAEGSPRRCSRSPEFLSRNLLSNAGFVASGAQLEEVLENTGFRLHVPNDLARTPLPDSEEVRLLREEIDSKSIYLDASV